MREEPFLTNDHLHEIRQRSDWRQLFHALGVVKDEKRSREHDWWGMSPLNPSERTASFHMNDHGWYCHSTSRGGGVIELVQACYPDLTCYDAGRWLLEHGVSSLINETRLAIELVDEGRTSTVLSEGEEGDGDHSSGSDDRQNQPIRQDLRPALDPEHPAFGARGIPPEVLRKLGAGFWQRRNPRKDDRPDPLDGRLVFQVRGLREDDAGYLRPTILTHTGRALTPKQTERDGKWWTFPGFHTSLELYNLDRVILDDEAEEQALETEHVILVEGCFDVAKLAAAGIHNVVATFGAHLHSGQLRGIHLLSEMIGIDRFLIWYDRDQDGSSPQKTGAQDAVALLQKRGYDATSFDWEQRFPSPRRGEVPIPPGIGDPAEFSVEQLQWLRREGWV